jgi:hypothetical protein
MVDEKNDSAVFLTMARTNVGKSCAGTLIESIRDFGGELSRCPVWLFEAHPEETPCGSLAGNGVRVIPLRVPDSVKQYYYADKVYACALAEEMATQNVRSLVWIDPGCLVIQPPLLFDLGTAFDAAVRPVHIKNVGLSPAQPLNVFWKRICEVVDMEDIRTTVETYVGAQRIRSYFNSHAFAINPSKGFLRWWFECFEILASDGEYQKAACPDDLHQIFLHQAVLSAALVSRFTPERIRILPPDYNYPYNLHSSAPVERRAAALNDLVCIAYEERPLNPGLVDDIAIHDPLRSWLSRNTAPG